MKKIRKVRVFMDLTDWDCEIGYASGGNKVYPSLRDIKEHGGKCLSECGIVEVEVRLVRIVKKSKLP